MKQCSDRTYFCSMCVCTLTKSAFVGILVLIWSASEPKSGPHLVGICSIFRKFTFGNTDLTYCLLVNSGKVSFKVGSPVPLSVTIGTYLRSLKCVFLFAILWYSILNIYFNLLPMDVPHVGLEACYQAKLYPTPWCQTAAHCWQSSHNHQHLVFWWRQSDHPPLSMLNYCA